MKKIQYTPYTCPGVPCGAECDHVVSVYDPEHVTRIDRHNAPAIHRGCIDILCDNGALNREVGLKAAQVVMLLPVHEASVSLTRMEQAVYGLVEGEDWNDFFFGEDIAALEIAATDPYLAQLFVILNLWFEIGMPIE